MTYQWRKNGANIIGAILSSYTIAAVVASDAATYSVKIVNGGGTVISSNATLTIAVPPGITTQPQSQTVAAGQDVSFAIVAAGTSPLSYQWSFNGMPLAGATNSTLTLTNVQTTDAGSYNAVVTNPYGSATSSAAALMVMSGWFRVVVNTNDSGGGSLRQALLDAVGSGVAVTKTIVFNITNVPTGGPFTISPLTALPSLIDNLTIDGYTQPGASRNTLTNGNNAVIKIRLSGASSGADGFSIGLGGCALYGLAIVNFPGNGIRLLGSGQAIIQGNFIGLDPDGVTVRANIGCGVRSSSLGGSVIGGSLPWQRNVISANLAGGIQLQNSPNNVIEGNFIGTDASGTLARGNSGIAVELRNPNSFGNLIGGSQPGQGNVISAATGPGTGNHGIALFSTFFNQVQGNLIGTDVTGTNALGNLGCGIYVTNGASANLIGGTNGGAGNMIACNNQQGAWIRDGTDNAILGNSIFANGGLGIDLGGAGIQPNDPGDPDVGANQLQNYPRLSGATNRGGILQITGSLDSVPGQDYRVEFFTSPGSGTTNSQGKHFIGAANITLSTGPANFTVSFPWAFSGDSVATATATDPAYNTSEFSASQPVVLVQPLPPTITSQPVPQTLEVGMDATFTVGVSGSAPFADQWFWNGTPFAGGTGASLILSNVQPAQAGSYWVVVSNSAGTATSAVANLTVLVPAQIAVQPASTAVLQGQNTSFSVSAFGDAPLSYQWSFNGMNLSGATSATLALANVQTNQAGNYAVLVTNNWGSVTSAVATLTVDFPAFITAQPQSETVTQGQTATFTVAASGTPILSYQWYLNGLMMGSGSSSATLNVSGAGTNNAGSYAVVVNNNYGSVTSSVASLTLLVPAQIAVQPASTSVVQGQNTSFSVSAFGDAPLTYQWSFNGTNLSGATNAALALANVQTNQAGNYAVLVTNNWGAVTSAVATLTVNVPAFITTQPQSVTVTQGQTATFTVAANGTPSLSYQWYFNGAIMGSGSSSSTLSVSGAGTNNAGSYAVVVNNSYGAVTSAVASLTVLVPPQIAVQPANTSVVQGQNTSFSVSAFGDAPLTYQWSFNGTNLSGATNATLALANAQTNQAGNYAVLAANNWGSVTSALATLTVNVPVFITTQPQSVAAMEGQTATFTVTASGTPSLSYQWYFNGAPMGSGSYSSTLSVSGAGTNNAGSYAVVVNNSYGSVTSAVATLTVTNPVINLSLSGGGGRSSTGFTFRASIPAGSTYVVVASTNLVDWTPIATNVAQSASTVITDSQAASYPRRFYKVLLP